MIASFDKLPFAMYQRIMDMVGKITDNDEATITLISILSGESEEYLLDLPLDEFAHYAKAAGFILERPTLPKVKTKYKIGKYTLIPTITTDKMTAGQYMDFQTYAKQGADTHSIELISCLLIPEGCKYNNGYDMADLHRTLKAELMTLDGMALISFFTARCAKSMRDTLISLVRQPLPTPMPREQRRTMRRVRRRLVRSLRGGDGFQFLMPWRRLTDALGKRLAR